MSPTAELTELHHLIGGLRRCAMALKSQYGEAPAMRRIVVDVERILTDVELLETDANELDLARWNAQHAKEKISIPDTDYDTDFWRDVDDEGVGGHGRP